MQQSQNTKPREGTSANLGAGWGTSGKRTRWWEKEPPQLPSWASLGATPKQLS